MTEQVKWVKNKKTNEDGNSFSKKLFSQETIQEVLKFHQSFELYKETPLRELKNLADYLGVAELYIKDESFRFGLNSFKVLGGSYAIGKCLAKKLNLDISEVTFSLLKSAEVKAQLGDITFSTATDGNHGRGVAWMVAQLGFKGVVYMPKGTTDKRLKHIQELGATASITEFNYDDTVRLVAEKARANGWEVVQDTAWEGYDEVPTWIIQGYSTMAQEVINQLLREKPSHIFLQAGVGAFAAAVVSVFVQAFTEEPPMIVIVEPSKADCFYESVKKGKIIPITGELNTIMAGLACGEPNPQAWSVLRQYADIFVSIPDWVAAKGMRMLGNPLKDDPRVISGESGAATMGLLAILLEKDLYSSLKEELKLNSQSKILLFSTEGDTDPEVYRKVVWDGAFPTQE